MAKAIRLSRLLANPKFASTKSTFARLESVAGIDEDEKLDVLHDKVDKVAKALRNRNILLHDDVYDHPGHQHIKDLTVEGTPEPELDEEERARPEEIASNIPRGADYDEGDDEDLARSLRVKGSGTDVTTEKTNRSYRGRKKGGRASAGDVFLTQEPKDPADVAAEKEERRKESEKKSALNEQQALLRTFKPMTEGMRQAVSGQQPSPDRESRPAAITPQTVSQFANDQRNPRVPHPDIGYHPNDIEHWLDAAHEFYGDSSIPVGSTKVQAGGRISSVREQDPDTGLLGTTKNNLRDAYWSLAGAFGHTHHSTPCGNPGCSNYSEGADCKSCASGKNPATADRSAQAKSVASANTARTITDKSGVDKKLAEAQAQLAFATKQDDVLKELHKSLSSTGSASLPLVDSEGNRIPEHEAVASLITKHHKLASDPASKLAKHLSTFGINIGDGTAKLSYEGGTDHADSSALHLSGFGLAGVLRGTHSAQQTLAQGAIKNAKRKVESFGGRAEAISSGADISEIQPRTFNVEQPRKFFTQSSIAPGVRSGWLTPQGELTQPATTQELSDVRSILPKRQLAADFGVRASVGSGPESFSAKPVKTLSSWYEENVANSANPGKIALKQYLQRIQSDPDMPHREQALTTVLKGVSDTMGRNGFVLHDDIFGHPEHQNPVPELLMKEER